MLSRTAEPLSSWTTLHLGGPARTLVEVTHRVELYETVRELDARGEPVLVLGGGSNVLVADAGFEGTVVRVGTRGVAVSDVACGGVGVTVEAGEDWDELVARAVHEEWVGLEALAGIPGTVGAVPIQNVGAYGQEVCDTVASVHVYDRTERRARTLSSVDCQFGYRTSMFKQKPGRYVVGGVTFQLRPGSLGPPVEYAELARTLGIEVGERAPAAEVRSAVLRLRASKGMVLDETDHDTWSAGSFFTNPFVAPGELPDGAPAWEQPDGRVKTSAAWLIERAGFTRGYGNERARLSTKHTLAVTNRGDASTDDVVALAREIRDGVRRTFDIELHPEPVLVGCSLD
ncbi:MAG: UDP-N-acetylmuramate dehydrogenase [Nocardioidaceae bacterium]|nr:UDP-N-acetylmuramate dehydrogenase [Nocardioidaceae bacterium]